MYGCYVYLLWQLMFFFNLTRILNIIYESININLCFIKQPLKISTKQGPSANRIDAWFKGIWIMFEYDIGLLHSPVLPHSQVLLTEKVSRYYKSYSLYLKNHKSECKKVTLENIRIPSNIHLVLIKLLASAWCEATQKKYIWIMNK